VSSVLRPHQHSIGYTGDGFYRSKDPTNSIKVLKEMLQRTKKTTETTKYRYTDIPCVSVILLCTQTRVVNSSEMLMFLHCTNTIHKTTQQVSDSTTTSHVRSV